MKLLEIELNILLDLLTYNKLFNYVDLPTMVASAIALCDIEKEVCYCEPTVNVEITRVWYPIQSWIDECKRRSDIERTLTEARKNHMCVDFPGLKQPNLQQQLVQAAVKGDMVEVKRIQELIERTIQ